MMKYLLVIGLAPFVLMGCVSYYVEPESNDVAMLTVLPIREVVGESVPPSVVLQIDGELVLRDHLISYKRDENGETRVVSYVKVTPGIHKITTQVTAYLDYRAKYGKHDMNVEFLRGSVYQIKVDIPEIVSQKYLGDSSAKIDIFNLSANSEILNKSLVLKDNGLRSIPRGDSNSTIEGIISTLPTN